MSKEAPSKSCDLRREDCVANRGLWYVTTCDCLVSKHGQLTAPVGDDQMFNQAMEAFDRDAEEQGDEQNPWQKT